MSTVRSNTRGWSSGASDGALWLVTPRGVSAVTEADALAAGRAAGLTDVKVVRFSDTHTAHKFVVPRANRHAPRTTTRQSPSAQQ